MTNVLVIHPRLADLRGADLARFEPVLRALGLRLILADHRPDPALARHFERVLELPPPHEVEAGWTALESFLARHPVDAVFSQTESGLPYGALAARAFGLRGPSPSAVHLCLDKHAGRRHLARAGVPQPEFTVAGDLAGARRAVRELGLPVVLKGCASANQRLVTLVRDEADLARAVARLQRGLAVSRDIARLEGLARAAGIELYTAPRREFLVEAYADGDPLECDGLVVGAEVESFGVTEQVHALSPSFFIEGYLTPADRPRGVRASGGSDAPRAPCPRPPRHGLLDRVPLGCSGLAPDRGQRSTRLRRGLRRPVRGRDRGAAEPPRLSPRDGDRARDRPGARRSPTRPATAPAGSVRSRTRRLSRASGRSGCAPA